MKNSLEKFIQILSAGKDLSASEAGDFFAALQSADQNESLIAAALLALEIKGATAEELFALASIMRSRAIKVHSKHKTFVDIVGTGGSTAKIFNVSTAAAFVIAGADVPVAKHGNRAATSRCGSADVLSVLGVNPAVDPEMAEKCLNEIGICFMFAPNFHTLSPVLGKVRRNLGVPTIFNNLGPLCNPATAPHQIIGVWCRNLVGKTAQVLAKLGTKKSWVVHGSDGLDEITLNGETLVAEITNGKVETFVISSFDFGLRSGAAFNFSKCSPTESAKIISDVLHSKLFDKNARNIVLINAAAAIYIAGSANNLRDSFSMAEKSLESGKALEKLRNLVEFSN